jgi:hypothetical protein
MALGTEGSGSGRSTEELRRESSQPRVGRSKHDLTTASPDAAWVAAEASAQPRADVVAMVSRDKNGNPAQSENFQVMVDDDAPDYVKDVAWNKAGEEMGARKYDAKKHGSMPELDHEARAKTESDELRRIRRGE